MKFNIQVCVITGLTALVLMACSNHEAQTATQNAVPTKTDVSTPAMTEVRSEVTKIVFLGDSLTAGYGLPSSQAWPEQVQKRLKTAGYITQIINAGVSGDNTANGLARYDWSVGSADADILVLALGANDFLQGVPPETMRQNLKSIIEKAQADGLTIILAGVASPQVELLGSRGKAYASVYSELAKEYKLSYFPSILEGVSGRPELLQRDGLHPTKAGVEIMADRFTSYISGVLDK